MERNSIDPKLIHIFIVEDDIEDYKQIPKYLYNDMIVGVKGIVKQREFIDNYFDGKIYKSLKMFWDAVFSLENIKWSDVDNNKDNILNLINLANNELLKLETL